MSPNSSTSSSQVFTFKYSSANGFAYLNAVYALINDTLSVPNGCVVVYVQSTNSLYLANDAGSGVTGPLTPGSAGHAVQQPVHHQRNGIVGKRGGQHADSGVVDYVQASIQGGEADLWLRSGQWRSW